MKDSPVQHSGIRGRLSAGQVVDKYVVDGIIGAGATSTVYRVRHRELGRTYALKVLSVISPAIHRRTLREARVQAGMRHRNIVGVYDVLEIGEAPGLLMEFIHGMTLESALLRHRFSQDHAELLFRGIVAGVRVAHEHGLVHRDLKPANILLEETGDELVPKVTDFGIAKVVAGPDQGHTRAGIPMGTPQYMAPEQIRDAGSVDERADIFSLGCILYELACGRRAFPQGDVLKVYNAVCDGELLPPSELVPELPDRFEDAILGALTVERRSRIPDIETLMAVFDGHMPWNLEEPTEIIRAPREVRRGEARFVPAHVLARLDATDDVELYDKTPAPETLVEDVAEPPPTRDLATRQLILPVLGLLGAAAFAAAWWSGAWP